MTEGGRATVLLVEDNPGDVELIKLAIQECVPPDALQVFPDGQSAFNYVAQGSLCSSTLVLLDLNLPGRSGFEILEAIKQTSGTTERIATVVLSSSSRASDRNRALALGATTFVSKPGTIEEVDALQVRLCELLSSLCAPSPEGERP